jgi:hypothetical protein
MRISCTLILAAIFTLTMVSLNAPLAQDDLTITDCQSRCGTRTWTGQVTGNPQAIAACGDRCEREFWDKVDRQGQKRKSSLFDD